MARTTSHWPDSYPAKIKTAAQAIGLIKPAQRVFIGSSCGEPQHLVRELAAQSGHLQDLEVVRILSLEKDPLTLMTERTEGQDLHIRSFYLGSAKPRRLSRSKRFITPINLSAVPRLFLSRRLPINVALVQVSPPDDFGWMSLGISVDVTKAAVQSADLVIAQVNPNMPRVLGRGFVHLNEVDYLVEHEEPLLTVGPPPEFEAAVRIGQLVSRLIEDGSTVQISLGATHNSFMTAVADKNDLGVHTQFLSDAIMSLYSMGVITNRRKGLNAGKLIASGAVGSNELYGFLHDNPAIEFHPSDYVNNPAVIAQHHKMVSLNVVMGMDLTGQVAADALPYNHFTGVNGLMDFTRGAGMAPDGKSVLMIPSTTLDGRSSRILPILESTAVVVPRGDVHYVATEYGLVNLFGKSLEERALAMISIAHPDFRDHLLERAKDFGLLSKKRASHEITSGVYPLHLEETRTYDGVEVLFRPAKPVDTRQIQEHFYHLEEQDVVKRFFQKKTRFVQDEVADFCEVDYVHDLSVVAVVGEAGYEEVIAVGTYFLDHSTNLAETAFSVAKEWQGKGLSTVILAKLAQNAREHGLAGLFALVSPANLGMIKLFQKLPYRLMSRLEENQLALTVRFDQPPEPEAAGVPA